MIPSEFAGEQLRAIRSLMERATIYRSISAPTALVGGLLSFGGFVVAYYAKHHRHSPLTPGQFLTVWLVILGLTGFANLIFLWRGASQRNEPFFSVGMKCAMLSLAPAFITVALVTCLVHRPIQLALVWVIFYGLALLATQPYAPRSLVLLGIAFLGTGLVLLPSWKHLLMPPGHGEPSALVVSGLMAATFGGYHLVYTAAVWAIGVGEDPAVASLDSHV